jgi:hypothetical protein
MWFTPVWHDQCQWVGSLRHDMQHLLAERGHDWCDHDKGWAGRCRLRHARDEDGDGWLPPRRWPHFSENLAPLRRYLEAQVGRPWNDVYAEIRSRIDARSAVQYHILQHLYQRLAVHTFVTASGSIWYRDQYGREHPVASHWRRMLYVCPRTGILRRPRIHQVWQKPGRIDRLPGSSDDHDYRQIQGQWYEVWWMTEPVTGDRLIVRKRQLSRRALRALGLRR